MDTGGEVLVLLCLMYIIPMIFFITSGICEYDSEAALFGLIWPIGLVSWLCGNK